MSDEKKQALVPVAPTTIHRPDPPRVERAHDDPIASMSFTDIMRMGDVLAPTGMLPQHIRNGAQAAAIIMAGRELGLPPMRSLRSLKLVKGNVVEDAASLFSRFKKDGGRGGFLHAACPHLPCVEERERRIAAALEGETPDLRDTHLDGEHACLWLRHPNGDDHVELFTIGDAEDAGLTSSAMYAKYTKAMLRSRAITAGLKSVGWDGAANVYGPGELDDEGDDGPPPPPPARQRSEGEQRRPPPRGPTTTGSGSAAAGSTSRAGASTTEQSGANRAARDPRLDLAPEERAFLVVDLLARAETKEEVAKIADGWTARVANGLRLHETLGLGVEAAIREANIRVGAPGVEELSPEEHEALQSLRAQKLAAIPMPSGVDDDPDKHTTR